MDLNFSINKRESLISRSECNIMRGLAILVIITNNFGHLVNGVHPDNEFTYDYANVSGFLDSLLHFNSLLPLELLSFYSPFGVMIFIFLSGYGLTLKYEYGNVFYMNLFKIKGSYFAIYHLVNYLRIPNLFNVNQPEENPKWEKYDFGGCIFFNGFSMEFGLNIIGLYDWIKRKIKK